MLFITQSGRYTSYAAKYPTAPSCDANSWRHSILSSFTQSPPSTSPPSPVFSSARERKNTPWDLKALNMCVCFLFSFVSSRNLHYVDQGRVNTFLHGLEENHYVKERAIKLLKSLKYFQHRSSLSCWSELGVVYSLGELFI